MHCGLCAGRSTRRGRPLGTVDCIRCCLVCGCFAGVKEVCVPWTPCVPPTPRSWVKQPDAMLLFSAALRFRMSLAEHMATVSVMAGLVTRTWPCASPEGVKTIALTHHTISGTPAAVSARLTRRALRVLWGTVAPPSAGAGVLAAATFVILCSASLSLSLRPCWQAHLRGQGAPLVTEFLPPYLFFRDSAVAAWPVCCDARLPRGHD